MLHFIVDSDFVLNGNSSIIVCIVTCRLRKGTTDWGFFYENLVVSMHGWIAFCILSML